MHLFVHTHSRMTVFGIERCKSCVSGCCSFLLNQQKHFCAQKKITLPSPSGVRLLLRKSSDAFFLRHITQQERPDMYSEKLYFQLYLFTSKMSLDGVM